MSDDHDHHQATSGWTLTIAIGLTLGFALVEALAGGWSGSLALVSDAGHMLTDGGALALAAGAAWLAKRPQSHRHTYGFARAEILAALLNAFFMLAVIAAITVSAIERLRSPGAVAGEAVTVVAIIGLVVNLGVAWVLSRGERNLNTRGAMVHVLGDLLGSVAALIAGVVVTYTGWTPIDPILSMAIAALILVSSVRLLREALHALMEGTPLHLPDRRDRTCARRPPGCEGGARPPRLDDLFGHDLAERPRRDRGHGAVGRTARRSRRAAAALRHQPLHAAARAGHSKGVLAEPRYCAVRCTDAMKQGFHRRDYRREAMSL